MSDSVPATHDTNQLDPNRYPGDAAILREHPELAPPTPEQKRTGAQMRAELEQRAGLAEGGDLFAVVNADASETLGQRLNTAIGTLQSAHEHLQKEQGIPAEKAAFMGRLNAEKAARDVLIFDAQQDLFDMRHTDGDNIEVTLKTGEIFRGTPLEVVSKLSESQVRTKQWAQDVAHAAGYERPRDLLREHGDNPIQQQPTHVPDTSQPIDASGITPDHIAKALGFSNGAELLEFGGSLVEMEQQRRLTETAATFYSACPDFPGGEAAETALAMIMEQAGLPNTAPGMAAAHALAVRAGYYKPLPSESELQPATRPVAPPLVTGSTVPQATPQNEYNMPKDQLRALLLKTPFQGGS